MDLALLAHGCRSLLGLGLSSSCAGPSGLLSSAASSCPWVRAPMPPGSPCASRPTSWLLPTLVVHYCRWAATLKGGLSIVPRDHLLVTWHLLPCRIGSDGASLALSPADCDVAPGAADPLPPSHHLLCTPPSVPIISALVHNLSPRCLASTHVSTGIYPRLWPAEHPLRASAVVRGLALTV
ncbi:unnamed protein product [Mycena citricolor]|uniref:Uncharacterized protein n=1 Tax=Mycena citricolor TaxID=2018698 RepID=A0AAD2HVD0_9AGAR|nr:unnamed protein product [Mycena citricolor]